MRTFEHRGGASHRFWHIERDGRRLTVRFGKVGARGRAQTTTCADAEAAIRELIRAKRADGWVETTPVVSSPERTALEQAVRENPDDLAASQAYADWLSEHGDPLGEFIQVQLALEDESRPAAERKKLQKREQQLFDENREQWLGDLAEVLLPSGKEHPSYLPLWMVEPAFCFVRGCLDEVQIPNLTVEQARTIARSPRMQTVRRFTIHGRVYYGPAGEPSYTPGEDVPAGLDYPQLLPLARSPYLGNVRVFHLGGPVEPREHQHDYDPSGHNVVDLLQRMPRLEELHLLAEVLTDPLFSLGTLKKLRVLRVSNGHHYPLFLLARNPAFANLTHLLLHAHAPEYELGPYLRLPEFRDVLRSPHLKSLTHLQFRVSNVGDDGCKEIVRSGALKRLKSLDLRHGCITDAGALTLASCSDLDRLEHLDVSRNSLTQEGIDELRSILPHAVVEPQHGPDDEEGLYLYEGDME